MIRFRPVLGLSIATALVLAGCGGSDGAADPGVTVTPTINVGRTNDPASQLLAEIYGQGLENAGYRIGRKDPVADEKAAIAGLQAGNIQLVPEFTGSLLAYLIANGFEVTTTTTVPTSDVPTSDVTSTDITTSLVPSTDPSTSGAVSTDASTPAATTLPGDSLPVDTVPGATADPNATENQMTAIRSRLPATLVVSDPAGVDNGLVVACGAAAIDQFTLATISDLAAATDLTIGGTADFEAATVGGLAALNTAYGATLTLTTVPDVAAAIADGTVDCGVLPAMTPNIVVDGLIVLQDDKAFAPHDALLTVMTADAGQADVLSVLDAINAKLSTDVIRSLLVKIQVDGQPYDVIAKQFLTSVSSTQ